MAGQSIPPEALAAVLNAAHGAGAKSAAQPDPAQGGQAPQGGGGAAAPQPDPSQGDPNAQGQDPNEQAVWQEFPATDPQNVQALASQMQSTQDPGELVQMLGQFMQQADADAQKLSQMHEVMLSQLMDLLQGPGEGQPAGGQSGPPPVAAQGPGVGGNGTGY